MIIVIKPTNIVNMFINFYKTVSPIQEKNIYSYNK